MVETTDIANEIRKHLADLFPDMTADQLVAALHEATEDLQKPRNNIRIA